MVWEKLGDGRVRRHFYPVLFDCSLGFGSWTCGFNDGCLQVKRGASGQSKLRLLKRARRVVGQRCSICLAIRKQRTNENAS
jgi:hypothetical protein